MSDEPEKPKSKKTRIIEEWRLSLIDKASLIVPDMVIAGFRVDGDELVVQRVAWRHEKGNVFTQNPWSY